MTDHFNNMLCAKIAVRSLERVVRVSVLCNLGKVDAPAVLEPFPQHQAPCPRPAIIPPITFRVELESRLSQ
jgi:hypothetical protein